MTGTRTDKTGAAAVAAALAIVLLALAGCNTAKGIGKDMESAGEAIQKEIEEEESE